MSKYVIIGGGAAGVAALQGILDNDSEAKISLLTKEDFLPYTRPMLSKTPLGFLNPKRYVIHSREWYDKRGVALYLDEEATELDAAAHVVRTSARELPYDKCIYAAGGYNFIPPFAGVNQEGVCDIRSVRDMERLKQEALGRREAVVIGGGAIGLETAFELMRYGLSVTVLEAAPYLMSRQLDPQTAEELRLKLNEYFAVHVDVKIEEIEGDGRANAVRLADGRRFPCGVVVISCGVRPHIALAQKAGMQINRAIVVNEWMETNVPDIYACGDCAEYNGLNYMLWSEAWSQGLVAGANAAGGSKAYEGADTSLIINTPYVSFFAFGDTGKGQGEYRVEVQKTQAESGVTVNAAMTESTERLFYLEDTLVGATILGNLARMQSVKQQIKEAQRHAR